MRRHLFLSALIAGAAAAPAVQAQTRDTGVPTMTQERMAQADPTMDILNWLGLLGLLGLWGLRKEHSDDSYHPSDLE
jgi:MYXO-CTERM domain-containing protein